MAAYVLEAQGYDSVEDEAPGDSLVGRESSNENKFGVVCGVCCSRNDFIIICVIPFWGCWSDPPPVWHL